MFLKLIEIVDSMQNVVVTAEVEDKGEYYSGSVSLDKMPEVLRLEFEEYELLINNQVLSLLDQIEEQISITSFTVIFDDGRKFYVDDLQIFPISGTISFKVSKQII
ncbi:hypothetical protein H6S82_20490 [Planktothrix sp. FACHB-1355]|uniref:Uncharacterized protein n=1 Tax=Aerosakkonema funiforme FACHB-1375 TaxID=2949571 RepID=A0A926ZHR6_9CYAN|nr:MULTISPECIES: hypothetical protein [Oscillatoriales]MBD2182467.1 hypothetical protein [Aerosakkonema funiforme FACHB-1375]MBD3561207.1 hypothetical protein [Planktothrix sp. FACHB-1355]